MTLVATGVGVAVPAGVAVGEPGVLVLVGVGEMVGVLVGPQPFNWTVVDTVTPQVVGEIGPKVTDPPWASVKTK